MPPRRTFLQPHILNRFLPARSPSGAWRESSTMIAQLQNGKFATESGFRHSLERGFLLARAI